jgi:hypothetical protein
MSAISSAMSSIFNNKEAQADIVLVCDNKRIYCHRAILSLRSLYFRAFLQKAHTEQSPALIAINISNLGYLPLFYLIKFLYTESVAFPDEILEVCNSFLLSSCLLTLLLSHTLSLLLFVLFSFFPSFFLLSDFLTFLSFSGCDCCSKEDDSSSVRRESQGQENKASQ